MRVEKDEQDYDAAEIDRELIASRLQKDVVSIPIQPQVTAKKGSQRQKGGYKII